VVVHKLQKIPAIGYLFLIATIIYCTTNKLQQKMDADPLKWIENISITACIIMLASCNTHTPTNTPTTSDSTTTNIATNTVAAIDTAGKRTLYLTFDDGPNTATQTVINILNSTQVPSSFFLIGYNLKTMPRAKQLLQVLKQMPNTAVCNHSYTHAYNNRYERFYKDLNGSVIDFNKCRDSVGFNNPITRTPGNNIWRTPKYSQTTFERYKPAANNISNSGYQIVGWDTEWRHYKNKLKQSVDKMEQEINDMFTNNENRCPNHCVLLTHDMTFLDPLDSAKLHQLIDRFKANPLYRFDVVTNHPYVRK
jgi:peptidoglycan-N-acetylglucosamine deacetylase